MAGLPLKLSKTSNDRLMQLYRTLTSTFAISNDLRLRFQEIDRKFSMEQSEKAKKNIKGKMDPVVTPTLLTHIETMQAQFAEIFLTGYPIFRPIASPKYIEEMNALRGAFAAQQRQFDWQRNLAIFFKDSAKYNYGCLEVVWDSYKFSSVGSDASGNAAITVQDIQGNRIKRLDPYNTFFDSTVPASTVHIDGQYAGYEEKMTRIKLKQLVEKLPSEGKQDCLETALKSNANGSNTYWRPIVVQNPLFEDEENWADFFGLNAGQDTEENTGMFFVTTLYSRIVPEDYKLSIPNKNNVGIWKFIIVNGSYIIYAEALTDSHQYLPILINSPTEDGLGKQTKSYGERLIPIQNLTSDMHTARIASLRRAISDRALYDPSRISPKDVNSPNPSAKIPVRGASYNQPVGNAYFPIPYRDEMAQYLLSESAQVDRYGQNITGQNPSSQGNFIPGNKTQTEFQTIMSNANNRTIVSAILMESQTMVPLKTMLLFNTLQYQQSELFVNVEEKQEVDYNPINVRQVNWDWEVADGLLPADKIATPAVYAQAFQTMAQLPGLASEYKVGDIFAYLLSLQGVKDLKQFKKTPEEIQKEQQQAMQMRIAEQAANAGTPTAQQQQQEQPPQ